MAIESKMSDPTFIHWFSQDVSLADNPAQNAAANKGSVLPIYILDDQNSRNNRMGEASRWWLHCSLLELDKSLNGNLCIFKGDPKKIIAELATAINATGIFWNRCYEPWRISRDKLIKADLIAKGINVESYNGSLLWEPWDVLKTDNTPYKVFTPFYRKGCLNAGSPRQPLPIPKNLRTKNINDFDLRLRFTFESSLEHLNLLPTKEWHH